MKHTSKYAFVAKLIAMPLNPGEAYVAHRNHVYTCTEISFQNMLYRFAREAGWKATSVAFDGCVVYSFYKGSDYMRPNLPAYPIVRKMKGEL